MDALDALRGFAILTMALSGRVPYTGLPDWMYHAQTPPPLRTFIPEVPGLTWVDLVFPFFLFAMGAAIPLALSHRIERGESTLRQALYALQRGVLLGVFAIYVQHIKPHFFAGHPTTVTWLLGLLGFALLFPMLARLPAGWPLVTRTAIRAAGWGGAVALMALARFGAEDRFSHLRSDIIIVVLANMAVFGTLTWLLTRNNLLLRLGFMGILIAIRLSHDSPGWVQYAWTWTPAPWIYKLYYLQYLLIVIPGTVAGDLMLAWSRPGDHADGKPAAWSTGRMGAVVLAVLAIAVFTLVGLQARWVIETPMLACVGCAAAWLLFRGPGHETERLLRRLFSWGVFWLMLGLVFEPYEGGIRKDQPTLSYYFVTSGLALFTLIAFFVVIDVFRKKRWVQLVIDNGKNPMIAYAGIQSLLAPLVVLTGLRAAMLPVTSTPWLGFVRACFETLLLACAVSLCTRLRIFWRT